MRISLVNQYAVPPDTGGGTRHVDLARRWAASGHDVEIVASSFHHFAQPRRVRTPPETRFGDSAVITSLWSPGYVGNGARRAADMAWFGVAATVHGARGPRPDVVIGSSPHPLAAWAAQLTAARHRVPFVYEVRDLWPQTLVDLGGLSADGYAASWLYRLERHLVEAAAATVVVPPAAGEYFAERGVRPRRLVHVPNGADPMGSRGPTTAAGRAAVELVESLQRRGRTVFVYAGSQGPVNGVDVLVWAAARAGSPVALVIVGDGPAREATEQAGRDTGAPDLHLLGQLPKPDALAVVAAGDASVFHLLDAPVFRFGLSPNKLFDYLFSGRCLLYAGPEVANPTSGAEAVVRAVPGDVGSIAAGMLTIASMAGAERERRGRAGRDSVLAAYSSDVLAARYLGLLVDVA